jgi:hypothetical protein
MYEEMLTITNKYTLVKEATLDNKDVKKDEEPSQLDRPSPSKNNDKKRKHNRSVANVERLWCNRTEYWLRLGEIKDFLDGICIFHPQGKHKTRDCNRLQEFVDEVLKSAKKDEQDKKAEDPMGDFSRLTRRSTTSTIDLTPMSQEGRKNSWPESSWQ